jgi:hypothetical protein
MRNGQSGHIVPYQKRWRLQPAEVGEAKWQLVFLILWNRQNWSMLGRSGSVSKSEAVKTLPHATSM